jgi:arylsulfatase A
MTDRLPNIVYIMADDMGYGDLGCYGATKIPTPYMDQLADEGVRFTDAHSSSAVCTPSRYSVLTGRFCWRTRLKWGVNGGFSRPLIDPARLTVAGMLKEHGYATAAVGKWHVGLDFQFDDVSKADPETWSDQGHWDYTKPILNGPTTLGFDYFFGIAGSLDMAPYCHIENDRTVGIPSVPKTPMNAQQQPGFMTPGWEDDQVDIIHLDKALAWIRKTHEADAEQPFFLYLTPSAPHRPCMADPAHQGRSDAGPRGDMVTIVDDMVGGVMNLLDELGLADNTLIMVTSDNGAQPYDVDGNTYGHKSCGDLRGYKTNIWDGGHREPLVARWPAKIAAGSTCDDLVCLSDFMATCAQIVGADLPDSAAEDSISFLPSLLAEDHEPRPALAHHSGSGVFALRKGDWKLILGRGSGCWEFPNLTQKQTDGFPGQLYNMRDDVRETTNLYGERPDIVEELTADLDKIILDGRSRP